MSTTDTLCGWGEHDRVTYYLNNVNILIPKRQEQLTMIVDLLGGLPQGVRRVLDLGSGFGAITQAILSHYPEATITCVDGSAEMLALAREHLQKDGTHVELLLGDLAFPSWQEAVRGPFDAVVSGLAIHHLLDARKRQLYHEVYALLDNGGLFLNNDAVLSPPALQEWFTALWYREMQAQEERLRGVKRSIESIRAELQERLRVGDHPSYMAPLAMQLAWLGEAGFASVECYWKYLDFAIFGGVKG